MEILSENITGISLSLSTFTPLLVASPPLSNHHHPPDVAGRTSSSRCNSAPRPPPCIVQKPLHQHHETHIRYLAPSTCATNSCGHLLPRHNTTTIHLSDPPRTETAQARSYHACLTTQQFRHILNFQASINR